MQLTRKKEQHKRLKREEDLSSRESKTKEFSERQKWLSSKLLSKKDKKLRPE